MATQSSILAWRTPLTDKPGRQLFLGSQRVRHDWVTFTFTCHYSDFCSYGFNFQCIISLSTSNVVAVATTKTRQWVLRASAFQSKVLLSLFHFQRLIQGYCYGIVRDGEFMPCTPTAAHLVPTQQGGHCSFLQRIFLTSVNQAPATKRFK